jgi:hypothetical protein
MVLCLRACASTHGHTLCCAVLTTETHQILCGKYPPGSTPRARHAPGFPPSQLEKMGAGKRGERRGFWRVTFRVQRRGLFKAKTALRMGDWQRQRAPRL